MWVIAVSKVLWKKEKKNAKKKRQALKAHICSHIQLRVGIGDAPPQRNLHQKICFGSV